MEKNKRLYKLMILMGAVMLIGTGAIIMLTGDLASADLIGTIVVIASWAVVAVVISMVVNNPNINRHYTLQRDNGKLRFVRRHYQPDPDGRRYISYGIVLLLIALLMAVIMATIRYSTSNTLILTLSVAIIIAVMIVIERTEKSIDEANRQQ